MKFSLISVSAYSLLEIAWVLIRKQNASSQQSCLSKSKVIFSPFIVTCYQTEKRVADFSFCKRLYFGKKAIGK